MKTTLWLPVFVALLVATPAAAQDDACKAIQLPQPLAPVTAARYMTRLDAAGCLGGDADKTPVTSAARTVVKSAWRKDLSIEDRHTAVRRALALIAEYLRTRPGTTDDSDESLTLFADRLEEVALHLGVN